MDAIEFIVVTPKTVEVKPQPISGIGAQRVSERIAVGPEGVVIRARGRRIVPDGPDLMFYTNAIRVSAASPLDTYDLCGFDRSRGLRIGALRGLRITRRILAVMRR